MEGPPGLAENLCSALHYFHAPQCSSAGSPEVLSGGLGIPERGFAFPSPQSQSLQSPHPSPPHCIPGPGGVVEQGQGDGGSPQHWGINLGQKVFLKTPDPTASPLPSGIPLNHPLHLSEAWKGPACLIAPLRTCAPLPWWMTADTVELGRAVDWPQQHRWASQTSASGPPAPSLCERASVSLSVVQADSTACLRLPDSFSS